MIVSAVTGNGQPGPFDFIKTDDEQQARFKRIRKAANELRTAIFQTLPAGHARKRALDRLQESMMWANWGISRDRKPKPKASVKCSDCELEYLEGTQHDCPAAQPAAVAS